MRLIILPALSGHKKKIVQKTCEAVIATIQRHLDERFDALAQRLEA